MLKRKDLEVTASAEVTGVKVSSYLSYYHFNR